METYNYLINGKVIDTKKIEVGTAIDPGDNPCDCFDIPEEVYPEPTEEGYAGSDEKGNFYEIVKVA